MGSSHASVTPVATSTAVTFHVPADTHAAPAAHVSTALTDVGLPKLTFSGAPASSAASATAVTSVPAAVESVPLTPSAGGESPKAADPSTSPFTKELQRQKAILPALPNVTITFQNLAVSVPVPIIDPVRTAVLCCVPLCGWI